MPTFINGKLYNIITYEDATPISNHPDFLDACSKYDILDFTNPNFNYPIDSLPNNIKYINLALCQKFNQPVDNLPSQLIGLSLPRGYNHPLLNHLPLGIKYMYFNEKWLNNYCRSIIKCAPASLIYLFTNTIHFDLETQKIMKTKYNLFGDCIYKHNTLFKIN